MTMYYKNGFYAEPQENGVELTDEQYETLIMGQSEGKQIVTNENGFPVLVEPQPSPYHELKNGEWTISAEAQKQWLEEVRERLTNQIDSHAASVYSQWTRFANEYAERQAAAEAFKQAGFEGEVSRYVSDFAKLARIDNKTAALLILQQAAGLEKLQVELANQRMRKYELKAPNLTVDQMFAIGDDIIRVMNTLAEAYQ